MGSIIGTMGCSSSIADRTSENVIRSAVLIQNWYRFRMAQLEMRRRYSLNIFQSIEYADEQDQLQLSNFFSFMLDHCTPTDAVSDIFASTNVPHEVEEGLSLTEFEKTVDVPDSYYGPRLSFPLTINDANALLHAFKSEQLLHARYVLQLLYETRRVLKEMPNITRISTSYSKEITVCGDLHGNLDDLLLIFYKNGLPSEQNPYVFNGDFVDRGKNSMEILIILFAFLLIYPNNLHLNRGNHEDYIMNLRYGFTKEVSRKYKEYGDQILRLLQDVFSWLPLATIINNKVLILHGGISNTTDLDFLNALERNKVKSLLRPPKSVRLRQDQVKKGIPTTRPTEKIASQNLAQKTQHISSSGSTKPSGSNLSSDPSEKEWKQILDILWSDPRSQKGCTPNKSRGGGCYFGPDVTAKLFKKYNLKMLIRSHEFKPEGYDISHNGKVITIFSASNYYEEGSNRGAYIKLNPELIPRFVQYQVSEHTQRQNLHNRVGTIESSALKSLREQIYAYKPELTSAFAQYDLNSTGRISVHDWAAAMESVLQLGLPWRMLRSQLVQLTPDGEVDFMSCFYDLKISQPVKEVQPALVETLCRYRKDLELIFNIIDKDHSGLISLEEFRHTWKLFTSHLGIDVTDESLGKLVLSIDYNKDGYIDFSEFLEAFHVVHRLERKANS
ncbi:serine/threonine-protein phosphatase with EF-hands 1 isoform X2 [Neopsephotus bourkii]|uniref:serine/threonine-protein phosphatase with EF-hands 1 isoform X2 n=1 Tax=Neopsephotus bourkii TaxID=309878 RepID=UPI002AA5B6E8|nr:serine/threonine-protein phosphatase with EF-hands 1 isoform X2 [Neopsephotus bourkii]XP_061220570.1 serine/threonine-protein phosphatase with EF-hands 1 isoform X2 [Neopsephotus bourkii]XP_061220571.1 serine/threonine-protein phosphatase with EF-hands 1 isoform X2 [Neopsephotus bourkii]XP_061220572.1 serine/threonine-protein phosphatase with EF-hands 1 isoform X2 [Neopsephotus bourkii]XP_061220573.1 serine/threonine-protein phosphatase with EF-hands 1 isoform X2 [Neopsephotus bourkii]